MFHAAFFYGIGDAVTQFAVGGGRRDMDYQRNVLGARHRNKFQGNDLAGCRLNLAHHHAVRAGLGLVKRL